FEHHGTASHVRDGRQALRRGRLRSTGQPEGSGPAEGYEGIDGQCFRHRRGKLTVMLRREKPPRCHRLAAAVSLALPLLLAAWTAPAFAASGDRADARGAATDTAAAIHEVIEAAASTSSDKAVYLAAAHRALNALVGRGSAEHVEPQLSSSAALGAPGHVNRLVGHRGSGAWPQPSEGVRVNLAVESRHLDAALKADGVDEFQLAASDALANLQLALGRASEMGALGGLKGALAWSELGVPEGAA